MDSDTSTRHNIDMLERVLLDRNAEPTHVPLSLLEHITNCFSDDRQIGSGGFAVVYKGIVGKGLVAVKKLSRTFDLPESKFHKEVECLMKAKHKNVVRFLGYCSETHGRIADNEGKFVMADLRNWLLCFEYVPNGSLDDHITDASGGLEWRVRYEIIRGICEGLHHLHEKRILHLDLKPCNILIDDHMVPKIADFGLSRCLDNEQTRAFTSNLCGSLGYLAPEFFRGEVAFASDIYSLGVIIMEILTGEKGYTEDDHIVQIWMNRLEKSDQWETQLEQVRVCIKIAIQCMDSNPKKRPIARRINNRLDKTTSTGKVDISSSLRNYMRCGGMDSNPKKRPIARHINTGLDKTASIGEADISSPRRNYLRYGGPLLEKMKCIKLFRKGQIKPSLLDENFVRKDGFGEVYNGIVDDVPVTIRKLISGTVLENGDFASEVIIQSKVIQKNIVRLIGCSIEFDVPMLVYEFLPKGLHEILHSHNRVPLSLAIRLSIAAESAVAIAYMHSSFITKMLHADVKPANILLDHNFVPKMSGFGMSGMTTRDRDIISDMAYTDPVYLQKGLLTQKSDVYSFGVVVLELLTRKEATHKFVKNFCKNRRMGRKSTELFDEEIAVAGNLELIENLAQIALKCLNHDAGRRPTMMDVAERLHTLKSIW